MAPRRQHHALYRGDVGVVSSPGDDNVVVLNRRCVRRVEVSPTKRRAAPHRNPRMSCVCARETFFAGRWDGPNVSAYIKRRQANAAHCGDHDMGEILADAPSAVKGFGRGRTDLSRLWIIGEVGPNAPRQLVRRVKNRTVAARSSVWHRLSLRQTAQHGGMGRARLPGSLDRETSSRSPPRRRSPKRGFASGRPFD